MALSAKAEHRQGAGTKWAVVENPLRKSRSACIEELDGCFFEFLELLLVVFNEITMLRIKMNDKI